MKRNIKIVTTALVALFFATSCTDDPKSTGRVFMPDMYYSPAGETYGQNNAFQNGMNAQLPVEGTIPRGFKPYSIPNTQEGYTRAGFEVKMHPALKTPESIKVGKRLFTTYCVVCHDEKGTGNGPIVASGKYPAPPPDFATRLKEITEGTMFHSITYGKGMMGSHASQLSADERWQIIYYLQKMVKVGDFAQGEKPEATEEASGEDEAIEETPTEG